MDAPPPSTETDQALLQLLQWLETAGYDFVTPTPATHARVLRRDPGRLARDVRDVLGWSRLFAADLVPEVFSLLEAAGLVRPSEGLWRATVRVSRLRGRLYLHSGFPTVQDDSVFLGPDSYRFADFIAAELTGAERGRIVDVGGGAGVGALSAAGQAPRAQVLLTDVNPKALDFARVNAAHAGVTLETRLSDGLAEVDAGLEVVLANPPYMAASEQTYRDGGDMHGGGLSLEWAKAAMTRLAPGGRMLLYTGSAILDGGRDALREALEDAVAAAGARLSWREIDPDVFGEELETRAYRDVERIAAIGAVITAPA